MGTGVFTPPAPPIPKKEKIMLPELLGLVAFACFTLAIYNAIALAKRPWRKRR